MSPSTQTLQGYSREVAGTAQGLLSAGVEPLRVAGVLTDLADALTGTLLRLAEAELGPPPCPYAWLALGSQGRREQVLVGDQDSALAYLDDTGPAHDFFTALAGRVVTGLRQAGFPPCAGGYLATRWCRSLATWQEVARRWVEEPDARALLEAEVFLDFRRVHGELSPQPLQDVLLRAADHRQFLVQMARAAVRFEPPLGLFGRIRTEGGAVDLKRHGTAAIVLLARLYALAAGSAARSTQERLAAAAAAGTLSGGGAQALTEAFRFLTGLRLREQLRSTAAGREPDNRVVLADLSAPERRRLREALRAVADVQQATVLRYRTEG